MNIYVSNLDFNMGNQELQDLFTPFGEVTSSNVISDKFTGRSRGFGFVEMTDDTAARTAMSTIDATEVGGRTINVKEANAKPARPAGIPIGNHY
ncbi:RNA-binding protein [Flaviaesturariibacter amylovorans]|uniref:RNA-binding protein n=1 Tax=Flaviaesturariibacter amylovorans TaxID=1084520 RepID=A0ABP8H0R8_9BACT